MKKFLTYILLTISLQLNATDICINYIKSVVKSTPSITGGTVVVDTINTCDFSLTATPTSNYKFAYWTNYLGEKNYKNTIDVSIDTELQNVLWSASFVNDNSFVYKWLNDSIIIRTLSTDLLSGSSNVGYAEIFIDSVLVHTSDSSIYRQDYGIWSYPISEIIEGNIYTSKQLHMILHNSCGVISGVIDTIIPTVIQGDSLASSIHTFETDVQVLSGACLIIDKNTTITGTLDIHEGGNVTILENYTLTANSIIMRGDALKKSWAQFVVNGTVNCSNPIYYDYTLDHKEYYPLALPSDVLGTSMTNTITGQTPSFASKRYNTDLRNAGSSGWEEYETEYFTGVGYVIYAPGVKWNNSKSTRQQTSVLRFPLDINLSLGESEKSIPIVSSSEDISINDKNWNLIGNPYLSEFTPNHTDESRVHIDEDDVRYITYSEDGFRSYKQNRLKGFTLLPFNCYFIQTESGDNITFEKSDRASYAPRRSKNMSEEIELGIVLNQSGTVDRTGILFGDYSDEYEINSDLVKWFGEQQPLSIYSISNGNPMAFQSLAMENLSRPILIGYRKAELKEMIISYDYENYNTNVIDAVWLFDSETGKYTNLLFEDYKFIPNNTQDDTRFYLSVEVSNIATKQTEVYTQTQSEYYDVLGRQVKPSSFGVYLEYTNGNCKKIIR